MTTDEETPEALLDLLQMGTELQTAELRIQEALRANRIITILKVLFADSLDTENTAQVDTTGDGYTKAEQLLGMHKILPDQGMESEVQSTDVPVHLRASRSHERRKIHHERRNKLQGQTWRYIPEEDSTALNLNSLVLRERLDKMLAERLQAILNASHLIRLLRQVLKNISLEGRHEIKKNLHQIQVRLEDDICYFFDQIDNDRTVPSFQVAVAMRVCAESMRQLWPHVSDKAEDEEQEGKMGQEKEKEDSSLSSLSSLSSAGTKVKEGFAENNDEVFDMDIHDPDDGSRLERVSHNWSIVGNDVLSKKKPIKNSVVSKQDNKRKSILKPKQLRRTPGPLVDLFVLSSLRPLASFVRLFSSNTPDGEHTRSSRASYHDNDNKVEDEDEDSWPNGDNGGNGDNSKPACHRNLESLKNLLERARNIVHIRLRTLRVSLGEDITTERSPSLSTSSVPTSVSPATAASSSASSRQPSKNITATHLLFIEELLKDMYNNKVWGLGLAIARAFGRAQETSPTATQPTPTLSSSSTKTGKAEPPSLFTTQDIIEAHKLAWDLVGDMSVANEPEAAQQAAKATDVLFKPVLLLHEKAEKEEYDRIAIQIVQKTPDSANMDTTNELNNHFQLFNKNLIATMNRYEVITMNEMSVIETFKLTRWEYHLDRILNNWMYFLYLLNSLILKKISSRLVNIASTSFKNNSSLALGLINAHAHYSPDFPEQREEEALQIQSSITSALSIVRSIVKASNEVVLPTIIRLTEERNAAMLQGKVAQLGTAAGRMHRRSRTNSLGKPLDRREPMMTMRTNRGTAMLDNEQSNLETQETEEDVTLYLEQAESTTADIIQAMNDKTRPLEKDISMALNQGWLVASTIELSQYHMSKQTKNDFVFCTEQNATHVCLEICDLFKKRKDALADLLSGHNRLSMEIAMRQELLKLVWAHILTFKFDINGANRMMIDVCMYDKCCQINAVPEEHGEEQRSRGRKDGGKTWKLLRIIVGLLVVPENQINELYPHIITSTNMNKKDFTDFVERRHDFNKCQGGNLFCIFDDVLHIVLPRQVLPEVSQ